jgi:hypothetical protein
MVSKIKQPSKRKLRLMRLANTRATAKFTGGGRLKTQGYKPVTLPKLKRDNT